MSEDDRDSGGMSRRQFLKGGAVLALGGAAAFLARSGEGLWHASTFVAKAKDYRQDLAGLMEQGLQHLGLDASWAKDKVVLLKPNLVEPFATSPHINTHPAFVLAAAETFLRRGARRVLVAEGQGHVRDTELVLDLSGLRAVLDEAKLPFVDLNHDTVFGRPNELRFTPLPGFFLPQTLQKADIIVSLPKMKTHHWAGVTLSMKNLFGVLPSMCYGWPKNLLHQVGIPRAIVDIASVVAPHLAIVDGIVGMEGDGPIMGTPRESGLMVMGTNLTAVDATCCRLMGIDPSRVQYLQLAAGILGPTEAWRIRQQGENLEGLGGTFQLLPAWEEKLRS